MENSKGDISPEEMQSMLAMLESLQAQGKDLSSISPDLPGLMAQIQRQKGQPSSDDVPTEEVLPTPAFVVKTTCLGTGMKVFINIVHSSKVPSPGNWQNGIPDEVQKALESREDAVGSGSEHLRFPLSAGQAKQDLDKKGERCVTVDCILNTDIVNQAAAFRPLKAFLIELAIGWVSHKTQMELDAKYKLPKMKYKGDEVEKQNIRVEKKKLVCEVTEVEEEPTFALRTTKAPAPTPEPAPPKAEPSKAAASKPGSGLRDMKCSVECKGRPADMIELGVILPPEAHEVTSEFINSIYVEASGRSALISIPGFNDVNLYLPYAVEGAGVATFDAASRKLQVELNLMSVHSYLDRLRNLKPLAFGDLGLHSDGLLDLD